MGTKIGNWLYQNAMAIFISTIAFAHRSERCYDKANRECGWRTLTLQYRLFVMRISKRYIINSLMKRYSGTMKKQTRSDRRIDNYYEKIRNSKQEKPFHEIILQVGGKGKYER